MNTLYFNRKIMTDTFVGKTLYVGLSSTEPSVNGTGYTEPTASSYKRAEYSGFTIGENATVHNNSDIIFDRADHVWFDDAHKAAYWLIFDGSSNLLAFGDLLEKKAVPFNTSVSIPADSLSIKLINAESQEV